MHTGVRNNVRTQAEECSPFSMTEHVVRERELERVVSLQGPNAYCYVVCFAVRSLLRLYLVTSHSLIKNEVAWSKHMRLASGCGGSHRSRSTAAKS